MKKKEIVLALLLIMIDQLTKFLVKINFELYQSKELIKGFFYLHYVQNKGAAWSIMEGAIIPFLILGTVVCVGIYFYLGKEKCTKLARIALVLVMAGAIGNMIDRGLQGYVVDFLDFIIFGYDYPVFNFADICLCIGCGLFALDVLLEKEG